MNTRPFIPGLALASLTFLPLSALAQLPKPTYGWNLGNTMEPPSGVGTWGGKPSAALIKSVAHSGFNTVRIPCAWDSHADQSTNKIDPAYLAQVKQVVDWCLAQHLHVIINAHWDGGWLENKLTGTVNPSIYAKMKAYWTQIALAFAGYDSRLLFAGANEPNVESAAQLSELLTYYQTFIDSVRATGGKNANRWLVVSGPSTDIEKTDKLMSALPKDTAKNRLMVEVHYYTPYPFCLMTKDESWGKMAYFWGQGYHSTTLPTRNATFGEEAALEALFQKLHTKFIAQGIPVLLGEFRADKRTNNPELTGANLRLHEASTTYWDKYVVDTAHSFGIAPIYWDTPGHLFDFATGAVLDKETLKALTGGPALPPPGGDPGQHGFELSAQGWKATGAGITSVSVSNNQKYAGTQSLAIGFGGAKGTASVSIPTPPIPAGKTVSLLLWVPSGSKLSAIEVYVLDRMGKRTGVRKTLGSLKPDAWNTVSLAIPKNAATPLQQLGVQFSSSAPWAGTCYLDSIRW